MSTHSIRQFAFVFERRQLECRVISLIDIGKIILVNSQVILASATRLHVRLP